MYGKADAETSKPGSLRRVLRCVHFYAFHADANRKRSKAVWLVNRRCGTLERKFFFSHFHGTAFLSGMDILRWSNPTDEEINLNKRSLRKLPTSISGFPNLRKCKLANNYLTFLPTELSELKRLKKIELQSNKFDQMPVPIFKLHKLHKLNMADNHLTSINQSITNLKQLRKLNLSGNKLINIDYITTLLKLEELHLSNNEIQSLPASIGDMSDLTVLYLDKNNLTTLPSDIKKLHQLERIDVSSNQIEIFPPGLCELNEVTSLRLANNNISLIPPDIANLSELLVLDLEYNQIANIPPALCDLKQLVELTLNINKLTCIPSDIKKLVRLQTLGLSDNQLNEIPPALCDMPKLTKLTLDGNGLSAIPSAIRNLRNLQKLDLSNNNISVIPSELLHMNQLIELRLGSNQLKCIPSEIGNLQQLEKLDLSHNEGISGADSLSSLDELSELKLNKNNLRSVPNMFKLKKLQVLHMNDNLIKEIPEEIQNLYSLKELWLDYNQLTSIPSEIGELTNLRELSLLMNKLTEITPAIGKLSMLRHLNLEYNKLKTLPEEVNNLIDCDIRLKGNPMSQDLDKESSYHKEDTKVVRIRRSQEYQSHKLPGGYFISIPPRAVQNDVDIKVQVVEDLQPELMDYPTMESNVIKLSGETQVLLNSAVKVGCQCKSADGLRDFALLKKEDVWTTLKSTREDQTVSTEVTDLGMFVFASRPHTEVLYVDESGCESSVDAGISIVVPAQTTNDRITVTQRVYNVDQHLVDNICNAGENEREISFSPLYRMITQEGHRTSASEPFVIGLPWPPTLDNMKDAELRILEDRHNINEWLDVTDTVHYEPRELDITISTPYMCGYVTARAVHKTTEEIVNNWNKVVKKVEEDIKLMKIVLLQKTDDPKTMLICLAEKCKMVEQVVRFQKWGYGTRLLKVPFSGDIQMHNGDKITIKSSDMFTLKTKKRTQSFHSLQDNYWWIRVEPKKRQEVPVVQKGFIEFYRIDHSHNDDSIDPYQAEPITELEFSLYSRLSDTELDVTIDILATYIQLENRWKKLGRQLGLTPGEIYKCSQKSDNLGKAHAMLDLWCKKSSQCKSINTLFTALENAHMDRYVNIIRASLPAAVIKRDFEKAIRYLSEELSSNQWKSFARTLGLSDACISHLVADNQRDEKEQIYQMLREWKMQNGSCASIDVLVDKLEQQQLQDLADYLRAIVM
uniref:Uncharacterized protein LOC100371525 n=1 Tax=Saccoglossus kowalevskii TaxID=10224 RepID=A0ABM0GSJ0_SACKO|nr:PREDICTED: uncharacterized protein LOC100371525 [Saccoglossus kowalevskii]